jgi:hypothetical protein
MKWAKGIGEIGVQCIFSWAENENAKSSEENLVEFDDVEFANTQKPEISPDL